MTEKLGKPTIAELEGLINKAEDGQIEVLPDGSCQRLNIAELTAKNLRIAKEEVELLRNRAKGMRVQLKKVMEILDDIVGAP
jgi:hypothetical protein